MAYLTQYSYSKLCQIVEINFEINLTSFLEHIYDDKELYVIFNKRDLVYLFKYKLILEDENKFCIEYFQPIPEREDTKEWVFNKGGKTKFHADANCKLLKKDYIDFHIPNEIRELGLDAIDEYRQWFQSNNFAEKYKAKAISKDFIILAFNSKYPKLYGIALIANNSNLLVVEKPNSNNVKVEKEFDYACFKGRLDYLKTKFNHEFPCKNTRILSKFRHLSGKPDIAIKEALSDIFSEDFATNYGINKINNKFNSAKEIINEIISLLLEYLRWKFDFKEKEFDKVTLETFGLECCRACSDK
jgi:hypothetical protein